MGCRIGNHVSTPGFARYVASSLEVRHTHTHTHTHTYTHSHIHTLTHTHTHTHHEYTYLAPIVQQLNLATLLTRVVRTEHPLAARQKVPCVLEQMKPDVARAEHRTQNFSSACLRKTVSHIRTYIRAYTRGHKRRHVFHRVARVVVAVAWLAWPTGDWHAANKTRQ